MDLRTVRADSPRTVCVQIITPPAALSRAVSKQLVMDVTEIDTKNSGDTSQSEGIWVILSEVTEGGLGLFGTAFVREEFAGLAAQAAAARRAP